MHRGRKGISAAMLGRIERMTHAASVWFERVGIIALLLMLGVTCIDVIGTKCFASPFLGAIDLITLSQVVAISFTVAIAQIAGRHIQVELFHSRLSAKAQAFIDILIYLFQAFFFALIVWRIYKLGRALQVAGEVTPTLFVPLYPFLYAMALGFVPMTMLFLLKTVHAAMKVVKQ